MKNFYVTYTFPSADSRDGFLQEVRLLADITRKEQGCLRYDYFLPGGFGKHAVFVGTVGISPGPGKTYKAAPLCPDRQAQGKILRFIQCQRTGV